MDMAGFYKDDEGSLLYGTVVFGPTYILIESEHETYTYPVDGWYWFDSEAAAKKFFNPPDLQEVPTP